MVETQKIKKVVEYTTDEPTTWWNISLINDMLKEIGIKAVFEIESQDNNNGEIVRLISEV